MAGKFFKVECLLKIYIKEVINMMSNKHLILSRIDESVALLLDLIFQCIDYINYIILANTSALNIQTFFD
jgi:hypothetical protein